MDALPAAPDNAAVVTVDEVTCKLSISHRPCSCSGPVEPRKGGVTFVSVGNVHLARYSPSALPVFIDSR